MNIDIDNLQKLSTIAYNGTVVTLSFGAVFTFLKARREEKRQQRMLALQEKHDFLSCTERYIKIQETIINNDCLSALNLSIYSQEAAAGAAGDTFSKELALCGMIFQLMEDVWLTHDLEKNKADPLYAGWIALFVDWMHAAPIAQKWSLLGHHFSADFRDYVEREIL